MGKQKVYVETSVISYLTSRPSRDLIVAGHQQLTRDWWERRSGDFHLVASELVLQEAGAGDADAARSRLKVLENLELLAVSEEALDLATALAEPGPLPESAAEDALHIAISVTSGIDYLLTWNCKHLANAAMRSSIDSVCRKKGYEPSIICTPEELLEE
jgi:predicted nucleic acid-binding protein